MSESSGHDDFDDAAEEVAKQMAWTPARVDSGSPDYYRGVCVPPERPTVLLSAAGISIDPL